MSRKKIVFGVVILAVLILAFTFGSKHYDDINTGMYDPAFKAPVFLLEEYKSSDDVLDPDAIVEDLNQLQKDIEDIHPKTLNGLSVAMTEAFKEAHEKARNPMTVQAFTLMVARIVRMLDDSQTYVDTYAIDARKIPLSIKRHNDQFFVIHGKGLKPKDEVLSMGNIDMVTLYDFYKRMIPSDNEFWYSRLFEDEIVYQDILAFAGAEMEGDTIVLNVKSDTGVNEVKMRFGEVAFEDVELDAGVKFQTYPAKAYGMPFRYRLDEELSTCHFVLSECEDSSEFRTFLSLMFKDIKDKKINHLIMDLRQNYGGDEAAIAEIMKYLPVDSYKDYGFIRRLSKQSSEQKPYKRTYGTLKKDVVSTENIRNNDDVFYGELFVLIDSGTSSEANRLGVVLKDNFLATVVGEPSGHSPSGYGDVLFRQLPNSNLIYYVSYTQFIRPNRDERFDNALYPDLLVQMGIEDYISGFDKTLNHVFDLIRDRL